MSATDAFVRQWVDKAEFGGSYGRCAATLTNLSLLFTQTAVSAVFHMQLYAGEIK